MRQHETPKLFGSARSGEIVAPTESLSEPSPCNASANPVGRCTRAHQNEPYRSTVSGNPLPQFVFPNIKPLRLEREEITRHGETTTTTITEIYHTASQAPPEGDGPGNSGDRRGLRPERGRIAPPHPGAIRNGTGTDRPLSDAARLIRALRRRDLLASVEEWRRASGPDRVWWRRDARHRLAEWRRLYRIPERAAFQQAVARSRSARP